MLQKPICFRIETAGSFAETMKKGICFQVNGLSTFFWTIGTLASLAVVRHEELLSSSEVSKDEVLSFSNQTIALCILCENYKTTKKGTARFRFLKERNTCWSKAQAKDAKFCKMANAKNSVETSKSTRSLAVATK